MLLDCDIRIKKLSWDVWQKGVPEKTDGRRMRIRGRIKKGLSLVDQEQPLCEKDQSSGTGSQ